MPESHPRQTLPQSARVRSRRDFQRVFDSRIRSTDQYIVLHAGLNGTEFSRLGIAAGRRLGGAVQRNRLKRLVREAFRRIRHELPPGIDWIVIPRAGAKPTVAELQCSIRSLAQRLRTELERASAKRKHQVP